MILVIILYLHTTVLPFLTADSRCQGRRQQGECRALLLVVAVGLESIKILQPKGGFLERFLKVPAPLSHLPPNAIEEEVLVSKIKVGQLFQFPESTEWSTMEDVSPKNAG